MIIFGLAPSASANYNGMSFAGRNGQYNNFPWMEQYSIIHLDWMHPLPAGKQMHNPFHLMPLNKYR